eukprot:TRINITY_DN7255_c0_g1_i1.p1 TRINITY_DN7255_c0_g1~~TRINITY_DN7255_c0_g1_i1.p1  ORF type:complete len:155 (+),score=25.68 TRINITY_DN7255_c0_g1_i1:59-523(+)
MDTRVMYSADQIKIPPELAPVIKQYTKEVIRSEEKWSQLGLYKWTTNYFAEQGGLPKIFEDDGSLVQNEKMISDVVHGADKFENVPWNDSEREQTLNTLFSQYSGGTDRIERSELPDLVADLKKSVGLDISEAVCSFLTPLPWLEPPKNNNHQK